MTEAPTDRSLDETASLHDGLAHPVRVAVMRILSEDAPLAVAELRGRVAQAHRELDTRSLQHHLYKMQVAGLVRVQAVEGREVARLIREVRLVVRPVPSDA